MVTRPVSPESTSESTALVIAIDGPAGAGKSTIGRALAERLGVGYLDTGAMYRAVTLAALRRGVRTGDHAGLAALAPTVDIDLAGARVVVDGEDATGAIRGREVTEHVSEVAANTAVRAELVQRQRAWVEDHGGGVVEGRDIGSVVFPDATLKLYITASARVRAQRRVAEIGGDVDEVERSIIERDRRDSTRDDSPLTTTPDMIEVDTSELTVDEIVSYIIDDLLDDPGNGPRVSNDRGPAETA